MASSPPLDDEPALDAPRPEREFTDLGFGTIIAQQARGRILSHDGAPAGRKDGLAPQRLAEADALVVARRG